MKGRRHILPAIIAPVAPEPLRHPGPGPNPKRLDPQILTQPNRALTLHYASGTESHQPGYIYPGKKRFESLAVDRELPGHPW